MAAFCQIVPSISIHALLAESDFHPPEKPLEIGISIHALLAESDISCAWSASKLGDFYPRSPCGERPYIIRHTVNLHSISIHALLAESDKHQTYQGGTHHISIHALLAESDNTSIAGRITSNDFYPRSPCGERRNVRKSHDTEYYFYPRSPCGERPPLACGTKTIPAISIHALLAESDARRASRQQPAGISIHALLAESDPRGQLPATQPPDFYPRSPCGERPKQPKHQ